MSSSPEDEQSGKSDRSLDELHAALRRRIRRDPQFGDTPSWLESAAAKRSVVRLMLRRLAADFERNCDQVPTSRVIRHFLKVEKGQAAWDDWKASADDWLAEVVSQPGWSGMGPSPWTVEGLIMVLANQTPGESFFQAEEFAELHSATNNTDATPEEVAMLVSQRIGGFEVSCEFAEAALRGIFDRVDPSGLFEVLGSKLSPHLAAAASDLRRIQAFDWETQFHSRHKGTLESPSLQFASGSPQSSPVVHHLEGPLTWLSEVTLTWYREPSSMLVVDCIGESGPSSPSRIVRDSATKKWSSVRSGANSTRDASIRAARRTADGVKLALDVLSNALDTTDERGHPMLTLMSGEGKDQRWPLVARFLGFVVDGVRADRPLAESRKAGRQLRGTLQGRMLMASALLRDLSPDLTPGSQMMLASSALECLVGDKKDRVNENVATHVSFLLEPNPGWRTFASAFVKKLYDHRSAVTHGVRDFVPQEAVAQMRTLVSGCMLSLIDRMEYATRMGQPADELVSEDLWDQYRQYALTGSFDASAAGLMAGHDVSIRRVRRLWCADQGIDLRGETDLFDEPDEE